MAVRYLQSADLLDLADDLAGRGRGPGKPRTIYLRRSISTAYYAVFHMITQHTAIRLLGPGWTVKHAAVARWVTHTDLAVSKAATLTYVDAARNAVDSAKALHANSEASYLRFLGLSVGGVKIAKSRS